MRPKAPHPPRSLTKTLKSLDYVARKLKGKIRKRISDPAQMASILRYQKRRRTWMLLKPLMLSMLQKAFGADTQAAKEFLELPRPQLKGKSFKQAFGPYRARYVYQELSAALSHLPTRQDKKTPPGAS